jgi:thiol:disulfide interchange protein DsbA
MRLIQKLFFALALAAAAGAHASADQPISGREYLVLPEIQNTEAGAKIEVTEFFSYACPHCNSFEPMLAAWVAKNQGKIVFKRVHLAFSAGEVPLQRLYSTLEAMGIAEANHAKVFEAIHVKRARMTSDEAVFEWAQSVGLDRAKFTDAYRSFGTQARVNRAKTLATSYMVRQWPMIAIDGRFMTSPHQVGSAVNPPLGEADSQQGAFKVMDILLTRALAEKK